MATLDSIELALTTNDYLSRNGAPAGGVLFSLWTKIPDPGPAPWSRGNMRVFRITASNWRVAGIVSNDNVTGAGGPNTGSLNCNLMLFTMPGEVYVDDFAYYQSAAIYSAADLKDWIFVAWWLKPGSTFTFKQYLRIGLAGSAFDATASGTDTSTAIPRASDPTSFNVADDAGDSNGYYFHANVTALTSAPTLADIDALAIATLPNTTAWGDWLLNWIGGNANLSDQSGNNRGMQLNPGGAILQGPDSPFTVPTIDVQPATILVKEGLTAAFTVTATTSGGTLHYQWKNNDANVGTDSSTYTTAAVTIADSGSVVLVVITDDNGSVQSDTAVLVVYEAPLGAWLTKP